MQVCKYYFYFFNKKMPLAEGIFMLRDSNTRNRSTHYIIADGGVSFVF